MNILDASPNAPTIRQIQRAIAARFGLSVQHLISHRRDQTCARPRFAAMWLARNVACLTNAEIGRMFGNRDPTTVGTAVRRADKLMAEDHAFAALLTAARRDLEDPFAAMQMELAA